jgi:tetratricopeptide (TPR) repeat protein
MSIFAMTHRVYHAVIGSAAMRAALSLVVLVVVSAVAVAQPAGDAPADKPDFARAAELYKQAEAEMAAGRFAEAARDYAIAYDVTKDPVLFFKIGSANDKAGRCDLALTYYRRYLKDGKPDAEFEKLTKERITSCEKAAGTEAGTGTGTEVGTGTGTEVGTGTGTGTEMGAAGVDDSTAQLSDGTKPALPVERPSKRRGVAWIVLGVGVAFGTLGAVSAISAEAAEKDLADLYETRVQGIPPEFSPDVQARYDDVIQQGERYQTLSWVAFGAAGVAFAGATFLFLTSSENETPPVSVQVTGSGASVSGAWSF